MAVGLSDIVTVIKNAVTALNNLNQTIGKVFPQGQAIAATATAGTNGAPPAQVANYLTITGPDGKSYKIGLYNP